MELAEIRDQNEVLRDVTEIRGSEARLLEFGRSQGVRSKSKGMPQKSRGGGGAKKQVLKDVTETRGLEARLRGIGRNQGVKCKS